MQINTPNTLRSGIGVYFDSGIGVVVTEWRWSVHSGFAQGGVNMVMMTIMMGIMIMVMIMMMGTMKIIIMMKKL